jgi:hypothetical protein
VFHKVTVYKAQFFGSYSDINYKKLWKSKIQSEGGGHRSTPHFNSHPFFERQLVDILKDDFLLLGAYLLENSRGSEPGVEPDISE